MLERRKKLCAFSFMEVNGSWGEIEGKFVEGRILRIHSIIFKTNLIVSYNFKSTLAGFCLKLNNFLIFLKDRENAVTHGTRMFLL